MSRVLPSMVASFPDFRAQLVAIHISFGIGIGTGTVERSYTGLVTDIWFLGRFCADQGAA